MFGIADYTQTVVRFENVLYGAESVCFFVENFEFAVRRQR